MNKEKNSYIIIYSVVMVVIVALALAFTSQALKTRKHANEQIDKMQQILRSVHIEPQKKDVIDTYKQVILTEALVSVKTGDIVKQFQGEERTKSEAFNINTNNQYKYLRDGIEEVTPIYIASVDGSTKYIVPLNGNGLWNIIWGYLALNDDGYSVYGADFGNAGETPGLGAEISKKFFADRFIDKHIGSPEQGVISVAVLKSGQKAAEGQDKVDGITGGTLTSNGVNDMLKNCLKYYEPFLAKLGNKVNSQQATITEPTNN